MPLLSLTTSLLPIVYLACPVGMGAMMFVMMRGSRGRSKAPDKPDRVSLADLKAEQARLAAEIDRLESRAAREPTMGDEARR